MFHSGCLISVSLFHSLQQAKGPLHHGPGWPMATPFPLFTTHDLSEKKHTFQPGVPARGMVLGVHKTERGERDRGEREEREEEEREKLATLFFPSHLSLHTCASVSRLAAL